MSENSGRAGRRGGFFGATNDFGGAAAEAALRYAELQKGLVSSAGFLTDRWLRHRLDGLSAGLETIERSLGCTDPAALGALQQDYWFGALDRWTADMAALVGAAAIAGRAAASPFRGQPDPPSPEWRVRPETAAPPQLRGRRSAKGSPATPAAIAWTEA